jgi:hypothetical protein
MISARRHSARKDLIASFTLRLGANYSKLISTDLIALIQKHILVSILQHHHFSLCLIDSFLNKHKTQIEFYLTYIFLTSHSCGELESVKPFKVKLVKHFK